MKKTFMNFATMFAAAMFVLASCEKPAGDDNSGNGGLKDPGNTEQGGNQNDNPGSNPGTNPGTTPSDLHVSLQGSAYVPVYLDAGSLEAIGSKVVADLSIDDTNRSLWLWEETYIGIASAGLNFYGDAADFLSLQVGTKGWAGAGFCITAPEQAGFCELADLKNWYLHFAYKPTRDISQLMTVIWAENEYKFAYGKDYVEYSSAGDGSVVGTHTAIAPLSGTVALNTWNEYEVCLEDMGIDFSKPSTGNYIVLNTDPTAGNLVNLDAIFFYKK